MVLEALVSSVRTLVAECVELARGRGDLDLMLLVSNISPMLRLSERENDGQSVLLD